VLFDLQKYLEITINWEELEAFCAESGKQLYRGLKARTLPANSNLTQLTSGAAEFFQYLQKAHNGMPVKLESNQG
jgi:hypothetical protein